MAFLKSYFANSSAGAHLELNEDTTLIDPTNGFYGVIDGFGGSGIGEATADFVKNTLLENYSTLSMDRDGTMPIYFNANYSVETNCLINSLKLAHSKILEKNSSKSINQRGGASFLGGVVRSRSIQLVSTGNCIGLKRSADQVTIVSFPDASSDLSIIGAARESFPHNGIGLSNELEFSVKDIGLRDNDLIVLLSSGAYAPFNLLELGVIIQEYGHQGAESLKIKLETLANNRGSQGNQSIVCLEF